MHRSRHALGVLALVAALTAAGPGALGGGWSAHGSGGGRATTRTLSPATAVQASCFVALVGRIDVTWNAPAGAPAGTTYVVTRTADGGATWTTVGSDATAPFLVSDSPSDGSYRYRVTARNQQWSAVAAADSGTRTLLLVNLLRVCL